MKKIKILLALLLTLCFTGCIFKMEDFGKRNGYTFFFINESSEDLYVEIVWGSTKETIEQQLDKGEEKFFGGNICREYIRIFDINAIHLYSDSTKSDLIYYETLNDKKTEKRILFLYNWDETQLDLSLAKRYFEYRYKDIEELYKLTFTFTDEFLEEVRE